MQALKTCLSSDAHNQIPTGTPSQLLGSSSSKCGTPRHPYPHTHMNQDVRITQVIQERVPSPPPCIRPRHQPRDILHQHPDTPPRNLWEATTTTTTASSSIYSTCACTVVCSTGLAVTAAGGAGSVVSCS
jgi:hypothetical protein